MAKKGNLTSKIRAIMDEIKKEAALEEKKTKKRREFSIHPDQKKTEKEKK